MPSNITKPKCTWDARPRTPLDYLYSNVLDGREAKDALEKLSSYIQIKTVSSEDPDYNGVGVFLGNYARELGLEFKKVQLPDFPEKPFYLLTLPGRNTKLPSILLMSHTEVVPAPAQDWIVDPFSGHIDDDEGKVYGRGTQDMKSVAIQYLEAIRQIVKRYWQHLEEMHRDTDQVENTRKSGSARSGEYLSSPLERSVHLLFAPDEEIRSSVMSTFLDTELFKSLQVAFALDEGCASCSSFYWLHYAEKTRVLAKFKVTGKPAHSASLQANSTGQRFAKLLSFLYNERNIQEKLMLAKKETSSEVITINVTMVSGGVQENMIPPELEATVDIRFPPKYSYPEINRLLEEWCRQAGPGVSFVDQRAVSAQSVCPCPCPNETAVVEPAATDKWWTLVTGALEKHLAPPQSVRYKAAVFPGASYAQFLRARGVPCIGFSPIANTPVLPHAENEFVYTKEFLRGVAVYIDIISDLANSAF